MGEKNFRACSASARLSQPFWIGDQVDVLNHVPVHEKPLREILRLLHSPGIDLGIGLDSRLSHPFTYE